MTVTYFCNARSRDWLLSSNEESQHDTCLNYSELKKLIVCTCPGAAGVAGCTVEHCQLCRANTGQNLCSPGCRDRRCEQTDYGTIFAISDRYDKLLDWFLAHWHVFASVKPLAISLFFADSSMARSWCRLIGTQVRPGNFPAKKHRSLKRKRWGAGEAGGWAHRQTANKRWYLW